MAYNQQEYEPAALTGGQQVIFTGRGIVHSIIVGNTTGTAIQMADSAVVNVISGTFLILKASIAEGTYLIDAHVANGLVVSNAVAGSYCVLYTQ
jgi:hypothetical protein